MLVDPEDWSKEQAVITILPASERKQSLAAMVWPMDTSPAAIDAQMAFHQVSHCHPPQSPRPTPTLSA